ncbi:MAG: DUF4097 domain-containing protein [Oscillospiraceae bacterium]|jgi:hypothetical protein|nr:DUF4097 domain-containing protein [Oscillospiraceae bacterium]
MNSKATRIGVTVVWAVVCVALIVMLGVGVFGKGLGILSWGSRETIMLKEESATADGIAKLNISTSSQDIRIVATDASEFGIRHYGPSDIKEDGLVRVSRDGDTLRVDLPDIRRVRLFGIFIGSERIEVEVPRSWTEGRVTARASSGDIKVESEFRWGGAEFGTSSGNLGISGSLTLREGISASASSGNVRVSDITAASADLKANSGDITAAGTVEVSGSFTAHTSSGDIELQGRISARDVIVETSSGDIDAQEVTAAGFDMKTSSGSLSCDTLTGGGQLKTTSGGIRVHRLNPLSDVDARSSSGGITLTIPPEYPFRFEAATSSGGINSDYDLYYTGRNSRTAFVDNGESPAITVTAEATSGGIRLNK